MLRFTVRRLAQRRASPCRHGRPCRVSDVPCRVHISVARVSARPAPETRLALTRPPIHDPARRTPLTRERGLDFDHPAGRLVLQPGHQQPPPGRQDAPVQPGFLRHPAARCRHRAPRRPRSSDPPHRSHRTGGQGPCWFFSTQSLRRSTSRAFNRAIATLTRPRRCDPRRARANRRSSSPNRTRSASRRPGTDSGSPVDSAALTTTPRSTPTTPPVPGAGSGTGTAAKATCQRPARSRVIRNDFTPGGSARDQRNRTHPTFGTFTSPTRRDRRRTSPGLTATIRKPSCRSRLRQDGRRGSEPAGNATHRTYYRTSPTEDGENHDPPCRVSSPP